jgi:hypothetical protein
LGEAVLSPTIETELVGTKATSRSARSYAMLAYLLVLAAYSKVVGLPSDTLQVFAWMWLATVAWNIQAPGRSHLVFVRDWWPALAVLEVYLYSRGLTDDIGLSVHVTAPIQVDQWMGGGELPTQYLQGQLCGNPCSHAMPPRWYDGALTGVYYTHFVAAPLVALVLWLRNRTIWLSWMRRYVTLYVAGLLVYITYPMAPPWMASRDGYISGSHVARITGRGWAEIGMGHFHQWLSRMGNQVAAMPSLHAATAALIAFYGISRLRSRWRFLLLLYPCAMSFMLVYYGEHYVVDVLAGFVLAGLVMWCCTDWERGGIVRRTALAVNTALLRVAGAAADVSVDRRTPVGAPVGAAVSDVGVSIEPVSGRPVSDGSGFDEPPLHEPVAVGRSSVSTFGREVDRRPAFLVALSSLPALVVPCVVLVLTLVALMASSYAALPALAILGGFVVWTAYLSWPELDLRGRLARGAFVGLVLAMAVIQIV